MWLVFKQIIVNVDDPCTNDESCGLMVEEPKVEMTFASKADVKAYYTNYAKKVGFSVSKRSYRSENDEK